MPSRLGSKVEGALLSRLGSRVEGALSAKGMSVVCREQEIWRRWAALLFNKKYLTEKIRRV